MIIGTFFTLFIVPSIYMLVARDRAAAGAAAPSAEPALGEFQPAAG
jgi:hypothetical protein